MNYKYIPNTKLRGMLENARQTRRRYKDSPDEKSNKVLKFKLNSKDKLKVSIPKVRKRHKAKLSVLQTYMKEAEKKRQDVKEGNMTALRSKKKKIKNSMPEINVKEDSDAVVEGEELSEEFKTKASTIFEAAVHQKVMEIATEKIEDLEKEYQSNLQEEIVSFRDELTEKVDGYLNYVVEEWMKENELALDSSLKSELTEEFMGGLKTLFTEHYIEVPDEKVDIVESLYDKVEELEEKLNSQIDDNVKVTDELNEYRKNKILEEVCDDLADTQSEKMKTLIEGVSYENDADDFENKVKTIKESYFPNQTKQDANVEQENDDSPTEETPEMNNIMEAYSKAIARK